MKGLEIANRYFHEWGLPYLRSHHAELVDRLAAGMISGSDSIGADDDISRDHNWGPGFSLWLTAEDFSAKGAALAADLHGAVPDVFDGFEIVAGFGSKAQSIRVRSMDEFFMDETSGHREMPASLDRWKPTLRDESHLYFLKHGRVFHDPLGQFSRRREAFCTWPRPTLLGRIGNTLWQLWHYGEYNFDRVAKRGDRLAVMLCKAEFIHHAMRLCFYLEEDFVPYWKWVAYCFRRLERGGEIADKLDRFNEETEIAMQKELIEGLCATLCARVIEKGYVSAGQVGGGSPLEIQARLETVRQQLQDLSQ
ncbi:MAG: DUF4037 domain-containing protein [Candidatus Latescibacteria bacterium]|nr:DUF4037 domain-containing protein [Candidatus Latescibacterota bacterium]